METGSSEDICRPGHPRPSARRESPQFHHRSLRECLLLDWLRQVEKLPWLRGGPSVSPHSMREARKYPWLAASQPYSLDSRKTPRFEKFLSRVLLLQVRFE